MANPQPLENGAEAACIRRFTFKTVGNQREVSLTHTKAVWTLYLDGRRIASERHNKWTIWQNKNLCMCFQVDVPGGQPVDGFLDMNWRAGGPVWAYALTVNDVLVHPSWTRKVGLMVVQPPEVVGWLEPPREDVLRLASTASMPLIEFAAHAPVPARPMPQNFDPFCDVDIADDDAEMGLPSFPAQPLSIADKILALPDGTMVPRQPPRILSARTLAEIEDTFGAQADPRFVLCELTPDDDGPGALLTFCERVQSPNHSRSEIIRPHVELNLATCNVNSESPRLARNQYMREVMVR